MPIFPVVFIPNQGNMKTDDYCEQCLKLWELCTDAGLKLLASAADGAKSEVNADEQWMMKVKTKKRLTYENSVYGIHISCPVYDDTESCFYVLPMSHGLMTVLRKVGVPLYIRDIFNPEKQDDGSARRLFLDTLSQFLADSDGNIIDVTFEGFFVLTFIFGELFGRVHEAGDVSHRTCHLHFSRPGLPHHLAAWRANIVDFESRYPDLFQKLSSFLADATFQILIRLCNQFILLILAHRKYYPDVPFLPRNHGSSFIEHFFGITRSFISEFTFGQLIQMNKHITFRQGILSSGKFNTKKEKDSNNGYIPDCDTPAPPTPAEVSALEQLLSCANLDPQMTILNASPDSESEDELPVSANNIDFGLDTIRVPLQPVEAAISTDDYEEPDGATGTKKQRLKAPRGAAKMQKTDGDSAPKEKSQKRKYALFGRSTEHIEIIPPTSDIDHPLIFGSGAPHACSLCGILSLYPPHLASSLPPRLSKPLLLATNAHARHPLHPPRQLKKLYNGKNKIPMQIFHDAYFEGKIDFKGDVLEILEQRHDWAKFTFTQELFRYVFMNFIPELIVHSKNKSAITMTSTHGSSDSDNKLAIVCSKLDLKPTDRFPPTRSVSCAAITVKTRRHVALIASVMPKSDPQSAHRARIPCMTLTWETGGRVMKWALCGVSRDIRQLNRWPEYPTASLLLSIAMKFMLTSLDNVQTTQTDSNAAKTMALDHLGVIAARIRSISAKGHAGGAEPEDVHTLISIKLALKYTQLQEVESMRAIAWAHQDRNLVDFEKAPCDYKDKLSSELTIRSHLAALYNTLLESPSLCPTLLSPLSAL
ncbi:hypothetical protein B0H14DRAFT_3476149 [Mycena olivaceomarginata]|nr:hypothetical protein B0H14DRAFT_3476149 [Mycena olivaceomarginata]